MINIQEKDLTKLATIHTKSRTKYFVQINFLDELNECIIFASNNDLKIVVLGKGTNILFTQQEYTDKLFIKLGKGFDYCKIKGEVIEIGGSYSFMRVGKKLTDLGYRDFIYMALIPGSLGGGVRQNAGTTNEGEVKDNFLSAKVYDLLEQKVKIFNKDNMDFSYRNSSIQKQANRYLVLSAKFGLGQKTEDIESLKDYVKERKQEKKDKEPNGYTFGSTFKSIKYPKQVWWYIDQVGLRSKSIGGAKFSQKHSNWIVNFENADAQNILDLIQEAKVKVMKTFSIELQIEIETI